MTEAADDSPRAPATPARRFLSDEQKLAIVNETEQPGVTVSGVARKHGIVTGLLFRWRVAFGVAQKKRATLATVALTDGAAATRVLRDLVQPPEGMIRVDCLTGDVSLFPRTAIQTPCERALCVGRSPHADRSCRSESVPGAGLRQYAKGMDGLAMLVQEVLIDGSCTSADERQ